MSSSPSRLVSVVIPCHDYGRFLAESVESALGQEDVEVEVIVVDDGSTDDTPQVAARYPQVRYLAQDAAGPSAARNRGLEESAGAFVVFLDADDRLRPGALRSSLDALDRRGDCVFAFGRHCYVDEDGSFLSAPPAPNVDGDLYRAMLRGEDHPVHTPGVVLYRRETVLGVGGFDTGLAGTEDLDLNLRIVRDSPACFNDRIVLDYRVHRSNLSGRPAHMLRQSVAVQRRQRGYVRSHPEYAADYRVGLRVARRYFGEKLARSAWIELRRGQLRRAAADVAVLARLDPLGALRYGAGGARHLVRRVTR